MTPALRIWAATAVGVVVTLWAWWHRIFNGANVLVICLLLACAYFLWRQERRESRCPHCGNALDHWVDPAKHRGDGI